MNPKEAPSMRTNDLRNNHWKFRRRNHRAGEVGQAMLLYILVLATFLLGALLFAFDLSNMWFRRQAAQSAADAACAAGAMDLLVDAQGGATGHQVFTLGSAYSCTATSSTSTPADPVCWYAAKNGYNSNGTNNLVSVSFPASVIGVTAPPASVASSPFIRVDVVDHVPTLFAGMVGGGTTKDVRAFSTCGVEEASAPIPLLVLDPKNPSKTTSALNVQGTPDIVIWGGPQQSIQVNSQDPAAVTVAGSATVDLRLGGPNNTGSDLGVYGGPATAPGGFLPGSTGQWRLSSPISDPFARINAPPTPTAGIITEVALGTHGCPDPLGCYEYQPGLYTTPICVGSSCALKKHTTAIFQGGIYVVNGFEAKSNSCLRPSTEDPDNIGGTMFYFTGGGAVNVDANSGSCSSGTCKCPAPFDPWAGTGMQGMKCTATSSVPSNLLSITTLTGNVMLAPCTGLYGDPYLAQGQPDPLGTQRGFLFFQDRSNTGMDQKWSGGGSFLLAGTMYFHSCNSTGTGTGCGAPPTYYSDTFELGGGSGASTYMLGDIVADNVLLGGNANITMDLNTTTAFSVLKASIFQ
jgi:Flp pilus assembly protein TadG